MALGIAGGYLLGRTKKMKLALMVGGLAAGRVAGGPGQLVAQATKLLGQSPEFSRLTEEVRGRLLEAGKAAAVTVATRQVEALTERLVGRVGSATDAAGRTVSDVGDVTGDVGQSVGDVGRQVGRVGRKDDAAANSASDVDESVVDEDTPTADGAADEGLADEGDGAPQAKARPSVRRRAPGDARRRAATGGTRAAAAASGAGDRRSGRSTRTRQEGSNG
ncbi:MAG: hypothetical protein JO147_12825 [Actinobacteria bacterium]|nr:hypothetical protein [Actinomycetota bacterium]